MNDPIVCYLFTCFDKIDSIKNFKHNYLKFNAGINHELKICFKLLNQTQINDISLELKDLQYQIFNDPSDKNDFDFGSYKRFAENHIDKDILFLNSHSYPICENWLKILMHFKKENNLIGTTASNESIINSISLKKKYKFFSYLFKLYKFKKNFLSFPNPHIRTSNFLIRGKYFLDFINKKKITNKFDSWKIESGKNNLSIFFKNKNLEVLVVNSDGDKYLEKNWKLSETYNYFNKSKLIISDKHTRKYDSLNIEDKLLSQYKVWGI